MKTQYTPGPWRVHYYGEIVGSQEKPGACVPVVCAPNESNPCRDANARLIAAAPELLSALQALLENAVACQRHISLLSGTGEETVEMPDAALDSPEMAIARAAIAKARGEA